MLRFARFVLWLAIAAVLVFGAGGPAPALAQSGRMPQPELLWPAPGEYVPPGPVTLQWSAVPGAGSYAVTIAQDGSYDYEEITTTTNSLTLTHLAAGHRYFWSVVAHDAAGALQPSHYTPFRWFALSAVKLAPATPLLFYTSQGSYQKYVLVEWSYATDASYYLVTRSSPQGGKTLTQKVTGKFSWRDQPAKAGETYLYQVQACNKHGCSAPTPAKTGWAGLCVELAAPILVYPTGGELVRYEPDLGEFYLEWVNVTGAGSYELEVRDARGNKLVVSETGYDRYLSVYNLDGSYLWRVRALDPAAGCRPGPWSQPANFSARPYPPPLAPASVQASQGTYPDKVVITWEQPSSETVPQDFDIYRSESASVPGQLIWSLAAGAANLFEDDTVEPGKVYYYRVSACHISRGCSTSPPVSGWAAAP